VLCQATAYLLYQVSLPGYWADKVLVWLWVIWTPFFIYLHFRRWQAKVYTGVLITLLLLSFVPFGLPFIYFISFLGASDRPYSREISNEYRIQEITRSPMVGTTIEVVKDSGLMEKHWNFGPNRDDTTYHLPNNVSVSLKTTMDKNLAVIRLPSKVVEVVLP
jgi:hypothetical protein